MTLIAFIIGIFVVCLIIGIGLSLLKTISGLFVSLFKGIFAIFAIILVCIGYLFRILIKEPILSVVLIALLYFFDSNIMKGLSILIYIYFYRKRVYKEAKEHVKKKINESFSILNTQPAIAINELQDIMPDDKIEGALWNKKKTEEVVKEIATQNGIVCGKLADDNWYYYIPQKLEKYVVGITVTIKEFINSQIKKYGIYD